MSDSKDPVEENFEEMSVGLMVFFLLLFASIAGMGIMVAFTIFMFVYLYLCF